MLSIHQCVGLPSGLFPSGFPTNFNYLMQTIYINFYVRFEVFKAVTMKNSVFWDVTPRGSCNNRRFGGT
jgi:hypothetical protein